MVVCFPDSTLMLSIGDEKVSQVTNSGFQTNEASIHVGILQDNIYI